MSLTSTAEQADPFPSELESFCPEEKALTFLLCSGSLKEPVGDTVVFSIPFTSQKPAGSGPTDRWSSLSQKPPVTGGFVDFID